MNINSLHHYLTKLSDSEKHYQSGHCFDGWNALPKVMIHGREVYRMYLIIRSSVPCTVKIP